MKYLITGACGFIGSNFADLVLTEKGVKNTVFNVDKVTSVSNTFLARKYDTSPRYRELSGHDLVGPEWTYIADKPDVVVHFAAESHVDRSCEDAAPFINSNITGTANVVKYCIRNDIPMVYISTDEVYGELGLDDAPFTEDSPINPRNPYSATKASGEFIVRSLANVKGFDKYAITRCSNNFGEHQDLTKFIPVCIYNLLYGKPIPLYGDGRQVRDWIHVNDHCSAVKFIVDELLSGKLTGGPVYNIGADNEWSNMEISKKLCDIANVSYDKGIKHITDPRGSAHDLRYAIDSSKFTNHTGWTPTFTHPFDKALEETFNWYKTQLDFRGII